MNTIKQTKKRKKCVQEKNDLDNIKTQKQKIQHIYNKCINNEYHEKSKKKNYSLEELLQTIKDQDSTNVIDLLDQFPHGAGIKDVINRDSHVFEAIWILVFLFNYDDLLESHQIRKFKKSIESNKEDKRTIKEIIKTPVNESNKSGICDIFFYHEEKSNARCDKCNKKINECICNKVTCKFNKDTETECGLPACSSDSNCKIIDTGKNTNNNYLFSAKYFNKERGVEHYDIPSIDIEARAKLSNYNIILLVKNNLGPNGLQKKMDKSKKEITNKFYKILD